MINALAIWRSVSFCSKSLAVYIRLLKLQVHFIWRSNSQKRKEAAFFILKCNKMEFLDEITIANQYVCMLNKSRIGETRKGKKEKTHIVPAIRVLMCVFSSSSSLAKPKSDILAFRSLSSSTLVALISLWTIFNLDSSCRYASPLAIAKHILFLVGQSKFSRWSSCPISDKGRGLTHKFIIEM